MNSIIGTLVNGEINNKTKKIKTELTFVVVLALCLADRKDYHFLLKIQFHKKKIWASKEKNVPQTQRQIFLLFPVFKKSPVGRVL